MTPIRVVTGEAAVLDLPADAFDAAVVSLVLCSVGDQRRALLELRRVLRPGDQLRFYEHVRAHTPTAARLQDTIDRVWPSIAGGCHINRDTLTAITDTGFLLDENHSFSFRPAICPPRPPP